MGLRFRREVLERLAAELEPEVRDEMAIPSYLHRNPAIRWLIARRMKRVLALADLQAGERLLDFGCGVGMLPLQLSQGFVEICATDLDVMPAERFLRAHGRDDVKLLPLPVWTESFGDETLDCVIALEVLEHVDEVPRLAREFRRKLRPGGRLVVCGPTENRLYAAGRRVAGFSGGYHHRNVYDFMEDLDRAGFRAAGRKSLPLPGPFALFLATRYERE